ncbi:MAG: hypothetical protein OHK0017_07970 [Patescibacteria group bacterium]
MDKFQLQQKELSKVFASLPTEFDMGAFLLDIFTPGELELIYKRWSIVKKLVQKENRNQRGIARELKVSVTSVNHQSAILKRGYVGYSTALKNLGICPTIKN